MIINAKTIKIMVFCCIVLCLCSCKKLELITGNKSALEQFFADNVLNRDFVVDFASDNGIEKTVEYKGYVFVLTKGETYYAGVLTGVKNNLSYTGTWSTPKDFSQLVINLNSPGSPAEFIFLNRVWKFTKKIPPVLQLRPYSDIDSKILYMRRL